MAEFLLYGIGTFLFLEICKTLAYIRSLDKRRRLRRLEGYERITLDLMEQLEQERRENRLMSDLLKDLVSEQ